MVKKIRIFLIYTIVVFSSQTLFAENNKQDTISTSTTIIANSVPIRNIVVTNSGKLRITSISGTTIAGPLLVMLGGTLNIDIQTPDSILFIYDESGNRIVRKITNKR